MIFDPKIFYSGYQKNYHKVKAIYLKKLYDDLERKEHLSNSEREVRLTLKIDLRQNYFHSIESFFELFFALNPKDQEKIDDESVLFRLTNSDWKATYDKIKEITQNEKALDFLYDKFSFMNNEITVGQYLFYTGIFSKEKFSPEVFEKITVSIDAIIHGMKIIAKDFVKREEYNSYKHGLRAIPSVNNMSILNARTKKLALSIDLKDSMSFYLKTKNPDEIISVAKPLDSNRDFNLTILCSEFIHHLIYFRKISLRIPEEKNMDEKVAITFFGKEIIDKSAEYSVQFTEMKYTVTKTN